MILQVESIAIVLLVVISIVALVAHRVRVPYTVALVLVGLILTFRPELKAEITPELILLIFVPPIAFDAAFHINLHQLRLSLRQILALAAPGVILTTLVIGAIVAASNIVPVGAAMVFGALISATDPVSVIALFRSFNISRQLEMIIESESLLNDGTAIVVFNIVLLAALGSTFDPVNGLIDFLRISIGGVIIGGALGYAASRLLASIDDYLVETTITTCLAFGAYLLADHYQVSGVLAVVTAGLMCGNMSDESMSPTTKLVISNFWEYVAFVANSLVFLLIGLAVNVSNLVDHLGAIAVGITAVLLSRAVVVYGLSWLLNRMKAKLPLSWQHVLFWGGLRGAISLALALSLPVALPERDTLRAMAFGVVLFTILVQGTTMQFLLKRLGLLNRHEHDLEHDLRFGALYAAEAAWRRLEQLHQEGLFRGDVWEALSQEHQQQRTELVTQLHDLYRKHNELRQELLSVAHREALLAERVALTEALHRGLIGDDAYRELSAQVDGRIQALDADTP